MAFVGNIMVAAAKGGKVYTFDVEDPNAEKQLAADMTDRVCTNGERGYVHPLPRCDSLFPLWLSSRPS